MKVIEVGNLHFELRQSTRRRTISLTVDRDGELVVHAPASAASEDIYGFVKTKLLWVHRKLNHKQQADKSAAAPAWVAGQGIYYRGRSYRLRFIDDAAEPLALRSDYWEMRRNARSQAPALFRQWFIRHSADWLSGRVATLASRVGVAHASVNVRDLGARWGSCTAAGRVLLNWMLLQLPDELIDYVLVHELTHINHRRHDRAFWNAVECAMPDYQRRREHLAREALRYMQFGRHFGSQCVRD